MIIFKSYHNLKLIKCNPKINLKIYINNNKS